MIDPTAPVTASPQNPAQPTSGSTGSTSAITSDFETFLKMLTVQMENQDPLNPIESSDFSVQLATFSGVEQQVQTNDLLSALAAQMTASGLADMAGWVGMEARAAAPAWFDGTTPLAMSPDPVAVADRAELVVRDQWGSEVQRLNVPITAETIEWDGIDSNRTPLPTGVYSFELVSYSQGDALQAEPVEVYQRVREIRSDGVGTTLILESGAEIPSASVTALRDPNLT